MSKYATVKEIIKEVQAVREVQKREGVLSARAEDGFSTLKILATVRPGFR